MAVTRIDHKAGLDARVAGEDLTGDLDKIIVLNTDGEAVLAGDGVAATGVLVEEGEAGDIVTVQTAGLARVKLGGTVATGALVASNASGLGVLATTGDYALGPCRKGGASGAIAEVYLTFPGRVA